MNIALQASATVHPKSASSTNNVMKRFVSVALVAAMTDLVTKVVAASALDSAQIVSISERLSFMLVYNTGSAGGVSIGPYTWAVNVAVTLVAIAMVLRIVQALAAVDPRATLPLALVTGGAIGNLASMIAGPEGVADFIAVQISESSTMVMNVADLWLWGGALMLAPVVVRLVTAVRAERRHARAGASTVR